MPDFSGRVEAEVLPAGAPPAARRAEPAVERLERVASAAAAAIAAALVTTAPA
jgi:hypothetical protein